MFVVILTVYFICTYLSESIEPFGNYFTCLLSDLSSLNFEIFICYLFFLFLLTQNFALERIHKVVVSPHNLSSVLCQMYPEGLSEQMKPCTTYVRYISIPVSDMILLGCYHC